MSILEQLMRVMESLISMKIHSPASNHMIKSAAGEFHLSEEFKTFYAVSDGVEIDPSGTVILPIKELCFFNNSLVLVGHLNFGDLLCTDYTGALYQIDHEQQAIFLQWPSLTYYLRDEFISALKAV